MAQQSRGAVKGYFQAGDIPSETEYVNLIDSYVALTHDQNSGSIHLTGSFGIVGNITSSGNISSSGIVTANTGSFSSININEASSFDTYNGLTADLAVIGNISASGIIMSNRTVTNQFDIGRINTTRPIIKILPGFSGSTHLDDGNTSIQSQRGLSLLINGGNEFPDDDDGTFRIHVQDVGTTMGFTGVNTTKVFEINKEGSIDMVKHITASGNISASGTLDITGNVNFDGDLDVLGTTNLDVVDIDGAVNMASTLIIGGNITANGNIIGDGSTAISSMASLGIGSVTATGTIQAEHFYSSDDAAIEDQLTAGRIYSIGRIQTDLHITASGNISASGDVIANEVFLDDAGSLKFANGTANEVRLRGQSGNLFIMSSSVIGLTINPGDGHITASGDISSSATVYANDLILDYDSLPSSDPENKGQIYMNGSNQLFISAG